MWINGTMKNEDASLEPFVTKRWEIVHDKKEVKLRKDYSTVARSRKVSRPQSLGDNFAFFVFAIKDVFVHFYVIYSEMLISDFIYRLFGNKYLYFFLPNLHLHS